MAFKLALQLATASALLVLAGWWIPSASVLRVDERPIPGSYNIVSAGNEDRSDSGDGVHADGDIVMQDCDNIDADGDVLMLDYDPRQHSRGRQALADNAAVRPNLLIALKRSI